MSRGLDHLWKLLLQAGDKFQSKESWPRRWIETLQNTYNGILSVMNSREEADYLSNYVYGVSVSHHNNPFLYLHLPLCVSFIAIYHFTYQWNSISEFGYRSHSQHKISGISRWYHHDWWYHGWQGEYKLHRSLWSRLHNKLCPNQRGYWCSN